MSTELQQAQNFVLRRLAQRTTEELRAQLAPKTHPPPVRFPRGASLGEERVEARWAALSANADSRAAIEDKETLARMEALGTRIENCIGTVKVPVGIAGPLRVNGLFAQGDFFVPLATTEAALVASYDRGAHLLTEAGGCTALLASEGICRTPGFAFRSLAEAGEFILWVMQQKEAFVAAAEATTQHGRLTDVRVTIEGNHVYLHFAFVTGAAAGQNMVTIATEAICALIRGKSPVQPEYSFVEANLSGDKKASAISFTTVRGKKVTAEARISADLVRRRLHTTPVRMEQYWRMSALGAVMGGTLGVQGHFANALAALYLACGQDVACVAESAVGITRMEVDEAGALYAAVTLPNVVLGTVGGGTGLPSQRACLELMGLSRPEDAPALAEVCAGLVLAGELSLIGALSAQEFTRAHARLARGRQPAPSAQSANSPDAIQP